MVDLGKQSVYIEQGATGPTRLFWALFHRTTFLPFIHVLKS